MTAPAKGLKPILRLWGKHFRWMAAGLLLAGVAAGAGIGLLSLSGWFIASAALAGLTPLTAHLFNLFHPSVGIRLFALLRTGARYGERLVNHDVTFRVLESLRTGFYRQIEPLAPAGLNAHRSGDVLERIVADIDALDTLYLRMGAPAFVALAATCLAAVLFGRFDSAAAWIVVAGMATGGLLLPLAAARTAARPGRALAQHGAELRIHTVEGLQGLAELLIFDAADRHRQAVQGCQRALIRAQAQMSRIGGLAAAGLTLVSGTTVGLVLYIGAGRVEKGLVAGPDLALLVFAALAVFEAVWPLPAGFQYLSRTREAARRLAGIVSETAPVPFPEGDAVPAHDGVRFEGVTFAYDPREPAVLEKFDLTIEAGRRVAVMGSTGAGKSTLVNLLVRFWDPQEGRVVWGGRDIRDLSEGTLRGGMAVVSQASHLFNDTLRRNLLLARPDADDAQLWAALETARLASFVADLPQGLDTWIGETGRTLSGGEARRLAVARALLRDAPLWLLDEPTEGLDMAHERELMETLLAATEGRTVMLITHRPVMLHRMDRIAVMENGRIVEEGPHEALLTAGGRYAQLWRQRR